MINSFEFTDFIKNVSFNALDELVSLDFVSIFTKIPDDLAISLGLSYTRI